MSFSRRGPFLDSNYSNLIAFDVQMRYNGGLDTGLTQVNAIISVDGQWITLHHERILWLSPEYRPGRSTVRDGMIFVGNKSGLVSVMKLCF